MVSIIVNNMIKTDRNFLITLNREAISSVMSKFRPTQACETSL